ncbi:MAG TPA: hypothetical protein VE568_05985 [Rubrobacter sp.]|nr:hypothetical protein [Rubrobacter sp.]
MFTHNVQTRVSTHAGEETLRERETIMFAREEAGAGPRFTSTSPPRRTPDLDPPGTVRSAATGVFS